MEKLERELRSCKRQVREIEKLLHHTERLYQSAESNNQELRTQVRGPPPAPRPIQPEMRPSKSKIASEGLPGRAQDCFIEYLKESKVQCDDNSRYI